MCGIFGIWNRNGQPLDLAALQRGVHAMRHRGPDDEGYLLADTRRGLAVHCAGADTEASLGLPPIEQFSNSRFDLALGFRRLAILDLSPAGHQPMRSRDGRFWIVFNGEIYNYRELRAQLESEGYAFSTNTDTEVILGAYDRWGADCLRHFNGMWGLAIWDGVKRTLFLARDRFGVKPCYIVRGAQGSLTFASEIKSLLASGSVRCEPLPAAVGTFAALGAFPSHRAGATFFRGIQSLPPSTYSFFDQSSEKSDAYWQIPDAAPQRPAEGEVQGAFRELLVDSIRLRVRSDVPVGTCLSGGLDSSTIVALVRQLMDSDGRRSLEGIGSRQHTFSAVYDDEGAWNERVHVDRVLAHTGAAGHFVIPTGEGLWEEIQAVLGYQDEPVQSSAIYAQWCVMRLAKLHGVTVLLDGQGADELLAGYRPYPAILQDLLRNFRVLAAWRTATQIHRVAGEPRRALLSAALRQLALMRIKRWLGVRSLRGRGARWETQTLGAAGLSETCRAATLGQVAQVAAEASQAEHESLEAQLRRQMTEESLPNLLRYEDRNSMAFSLEARVPFLDYRLVEFVFRHAAPWRFRAGWTKWIQRNCVAGDLPAEIAWRRDKVGYDVPELHWLRSRKSELLGLFASAPGFSDYFDVDFVRSATGELLARGAKRDGRRVWRWLNLALWLKSLETYRGADASDRPRPATLSCVAATESSVNDVLPLGHSEPFATPLGNDRIS